MQIYNGLQHNTPSKKRIQITESVFLTQETLKNFLAVILIVYERKKSQSTSQYLVQK